MSIHVLFGYFLNVKTKEKLFLSEHFELCLKRCLDYGFFLFLNFPALIYFRSINLVFLFYSYVGAGQFKKVSNTVVNGSVYVCAVLWSALGI